MGRFNRTLQGPGPMDQMLTLADFGMRLQKQKQDAQAAAAKQAQDDRTYKIEYGTGDPETRGQYMTNPGMNQAVDMSNYTPGLEERKVRLTEQKFQAEQNNPKNAHAREMAAPPDITRIIAASKKPEYSSLSPMFNSAIEHLSSGNIKNKRDLYNAMEEEYVLRGESMRQSTLKEIERDIASGNNARARNRAELLKAFDPNFVKKFFGFPKEELETQQFPNLSTKEPSQERLYGTDEGYLPTDQAMGKMPFRGSAEGVEGRFSAGQELTSIRQDKASLKREISKISALPDLDVYRKEKAQIPDMQDELNDLVTREQEILGKTNEKPRLIINNKSVGEETKLKGSDEELGRIRLPDGLSEFDINYNMEMYGKSRQEVIQQFIKLNTGRLKGVK